MPVPPRTTHPKAEAKYNVTTDFPSLGLHAAASTGDVGLVEYALEHGQPVNSVLDGVLPLHAACAGGNVQVVKLLIDHGADVNALRLPRKYSTDKARDPSAPIVGTSGSTPLHFAAANGNTAVVNLLLLHGARADRADKHGITPEKLASDNGWLECAQVLRNWVLNKDRDLKEREGLDLASVPSASTSTTRDASYPSETPSRRRLHVKNSIDTALNMLKSVDSFARAPHSTSAQTSTPPASPLRPFGEYTFYPPTDSHLPIDPGHRRPSLPHILQPPSPDVSRNRRGSPYSVPRKQRRPRSAGNGAEPSQEEQMHPVYGRGGAARRLGSKYSLLNIFKKAQQGDGAENLSDQGSVRESQGLSSGAASTTTLPLAITPSNSRQPPDGDEPIHGTPSSVTSSCPLSRSAFRYHRGSDASTRGNHPLVSTQPASPSPPPLARKQSGSIRNNTPSAVELHHTLASRTRSNTQPEEDEKSKSSSPLARLRQVSHNRNRSTSSANTIPLDPIANDRPLHSPSNLDPDSEKPNASPRPGILRAHNRTSSIGQSPSLLPSRTLRFDPSPTLSPPDRKIRPGESPRTAPTQLRSYNSASSLSKLAAETIHSEPEDSTNSHTDEPPPVLDDDDDENYGQPIETTELNNAPSLLLQRQRGSSFASSQSSLSPILTADSANETATSLIDADFPFSLNQPVPETDSPEVDRLHVPLADIRHRGDSLSSQSTADSRNAGRTDSSTTSGPSLSTPGLDNALLTLPFEDDKTSSSETEVRTAENGYAPEAYISASRNGIAPSHRRIPNPLDIDISNISSHAQAEALVERARKEALDLASVQEVSPLSMLDGRTPLSARLAAYGESLALERKLREQKGQKVSVDLQRTGSISPEYPMPPQLSVAPSSRRDGVERQLSLENKTGSPRGRRNGKDPRRPSTAEGRKSPALRLDQDVSPGLLVPSAESDYSSSIQVLSAPAFNAPQFLPIGSASSTLPLHPPYSAPLGTYDPLSGLEDTEPLPRRSFSKPMHTNPPDHALSRISSADGTEVPGHDPLHPLDRVSTPPSTRNRRDVRTATAKKLAKMGIPRLEAEAAAGNRAPLHQPSNKGFIKNIISSIKGRPT